jgi:hypothetical protein
MKSYFSEYQDLFNKGKYKFDLVLYLINASNARFFSKSEIELIDYIDKMQLPIFFVCTKSKTEEYAKDNEEIIKLGLMKNLDEETAEKLIEKIFSCHLKDEKDSNYKQFGIDKLFKGIYEYFKDSNLPIDDLEGLEKKMEHIIEQYQKYSLEIKNNDGSFLEDLEQISINHMNFELNLGEDKIKESNKYGNKCQQTQNLIEDIKEIIASDNYSILCSWSRLNETDKRKKIFNCLGNMFKSILDNKKSDINFLNNYNENTNNDYKKGINFFKSQINKNIK